MSILCLPAELRLYIYDFLLPNNPLSSPRRTYTGLLNSCKEIRNELEPEIVKRVVPFFKEIQGRCRTVYDSEDLQYDEPECVNDLYNLKFTRPIRSSMFARNDPFMALLYLHFTTLTIACLVPPDSSFNSTYSPTPDVRFYPEYRYNTNNLVYWISKINNWEGQSSVRKIIYEWPSDPQTWTWRWNNATAIDSKLWKVQLRTVNIEFGRSQPRIYAAVFDRRAC